MPDLVGWGILGCGDITEKRGAPAIVAQGDSRLVGFHSRTPGRAAGFAARHGGYGVENRAELLADGAVTAVYVATEHHRHPEDAIAAAEAGKHVLCEKPLALTEAAARRIIHACRANAVGLQVAYYRRYYPKMLHLRALLHAGRIGKPVSAHIHLAHRLPPEQSTGANWRLDATRGGGGALVDTGSHRLDLLCWLMGPPVELYSCTARDELPVSVPDTETLLIRLESGVHVTSVHGYRTASPDTFEIWGTEGMLAATPVDGPELLLRTGDAEERWDLPRHANVHFPLFDDFAGRLRAGLQPRYGGEDALPATRIIEAATAGISGPLRADG